MTKIRRAFTDEFKREAVALVPSSGRRLTQIASGLGVQRSLLRSWRGTLNRTRQASAGPGTVSTPSLRPQPAERARLLVVLGVPARYERGVEVELKGTPVHIHPRDLDHRSNLLIGSGCGS